MAQFIANFVDAFRVELPITAVNLDLMIFW